jgi:hypothetical protein
MKRGALRIGTLDLEIACASVEQRKRILESLSEGLECGLLDSLDSLDAFACGRDVRIERIDVDLGSLSEGEFVSTLGERIAGELDAFLVRRESSAAGDVLYRETGGSASLKTEKPRGLLTPGELEATVVERRDPVLAHVFGVLRDLRERGTMDPERLERMLALVLEASLGGTPVDGQWRMRVENAVGLGWNEMERLALLPEGGMAPVPISPVFSMEAAVREESRSRGDDVKTLRSTSDREDERCESGTGGSVRSEDAGREATDPLAERPRETPAGEGLQAPARRRGQAESSLSEEAPHAPKAALRHLLRLLRQPAEGFCEDVDALTREILCDDEGTRDLLRVLDVAADPAESLASALSEDAWNLLLERRHGASGLRRARECAARVRLATDACGADIPQAAWRLSMLQMAAPAEGAAAAVRACRDLLVSLGRTRGTNVPGKAVAVLESSMAREMPQPFLASAHAKIRSLEAERNARPRGIAVQDSGLVLLAPFIPRLFGMLGLLQEDGSLGIGERRRAAPLLGSLASGSAPVPENESVLSRLLCALPTGVPIDPGPIPGEWQDVCRQMLEAVIAHWSALGNTSPQGLRETFLLRGGSLEEGETSWRLEVERGPFDMLLERIPWGFASVSLSWMEKPLMVEWK